MSNPQTPDVSKSTSTMSKKRTPRTPAGNGLTIAERTKLQMEEREKKLKQLQEQLMEEYTFTPKSSVSSHSVASSITAASATPDRTLVFDRLYNKETASMKARRVSTPRSTKKPQTFETPRAKGIKDGYVTPTRLEALHHEGQNRLRSRMKSDEVRIKLCAFSKVCKIRQCLNVFMVMVGRGKCQETAP